MVAAREVNIGIDYSINEVSSCLRCYFISEDGKKIFDIDDITVKCKGCGSNGIPMVLNSKLQCEDCSYEQDGKKCAEESIKLAKKIIKMLEGRIAHYELDKKNHLTKTDELNTTIAKRND